jgi:hypothetical protein
MHKMNQCFLLLTLISAVGRAEVRVASTFAQLRTTVVAAIAAGDAASTLIATDIDNTLLALDDDFGSEHWFLWQKSLIDQHDNPARLTSNVADLLKLQAFIYDMSPSHLVAPEMRDFYNSLMDTGSHFIAVTSRSSTVRDLTLRDIDLQGLEIKKHAPILRLDGEFGTVFSTDSIGRILSRDATADDSRLTQELLRKFEISETGPVAYNRGILLTNGQNKGLMLAAFIKRASLPEIRQIVFIDDRLSHVKAVDDFFAAYDPKMTVISIHFTATRPHIEAFEQSEKREVIQNGCLLISALENIWPWRDDRSWIWPVPACSPGE